MTALAARPLALIVAPVAAAALTIVGGSRTPRQERRDESSSRRTRPIPMPLSSSRWGSTSPTPTGSPQLWVSSDSYAAAARGSRMSPGCVILGISSIRGFLVSDFIDSAIGRLVGNNEMVRVGEAVEEQMGTSGHDGSRLGLPAARLSTGGDRRLAVCAATVMGSRVGNRGYGDFHPLRRNPARQRAPDGRIRRIHSRAHEDRPVRLAVTRKPTDCPGRLALARFTGEVGTKIGKEVPGSRNAWSKNKERG